MLSRERKVPLRKLPDFFSNARRTGVLGITVYSLAHTGQLQLSVVASKKVAPRATERNALKREVYALVTELLSQKPLALSLQLVLVLQKRWLTTSTEEKKQLLEKIFAQLTYTTARIPDTV